jgi:hypothetical protein
MYTITSYSPQVCLNDRSTGKYCVNTQIHEWSNMKISTTLVTKSDFGIKILMKQSMTIYDKGMQLLSYNYAAHCEKKKVYILWGIWQMWNAHTDFASKVWLIVKHEKSICTLQWGQYNKPQWLMEQTVLAILLYNVIFGVINTLKSQDKWLILLAYFSLLNHLQLYSVFKRNNFVPPQKKKTVYYHAYRNLKLKG